MYFTWIIYFDPHGFQATGVSYGMVMVVSWNMPAQRTRFEYCQPRKLSFLCLNPSLLD